MKNVLKNFTAALLHPFARTGERTTLTPLQMSMLRRREQENALPWLTPYRAVELYEAYRAGNFAEIQLVFDQLEEYDPSLYTALGKRQRALAAMPWQVSIDAKAVGKDPQKQQLAEAQQEYLTRLLLAVENLEEAIVHLGMADFRGVAALEITGNDRRQRWEVIEPWNLARPARRGPWLYNPDAAATYTSLEMLDARACIIREERPIDLPAMFLIVDKMHAIKGWDTFLDVFGSPSIFLELPPGTSEEMAAAFDERVQRIVSDGRGTIPGGSKFQTVETTANNSASFEDRARWCREAIITIALGGLLTVEAESGSGTLAGNAHEDSFTELCKGTAASISNAINLQWARPRLLKAFPNQRIYAYFEVAPAPVDDREKEAQIIATLAAAGYRSSVEQVQELTGLEVTDTPPAPPAAMGGPVSNRAAAAAAAEDAPLTPQELAAFAGLATPNPARMEQRRAEVEARLRAAADLPAEEEGAMVTNGCTKMDCTIHPHKGKVEEAKKDARAVIRKLKKNSFSNKDNTFRVRVHGELEGEVGHNVGATVSNLEGLGIDADTAKRLHYAAAARIKELFINSEKPVEVPLDESVEQQMDYQYNKAVAKAKKDNPNAKPPTKEEVTYKLKERIWKCKVPVLLTKDKKPAMVDITIAQFRGRTTPTLYSMVIRQRETPA